MHYTRMTQFCAVGSGGSSGGGGGGFGGGGGGGTVFPAELAG